MCVREKRATYAFEEALSGCETFWPRPRLSLAPASSCYMCDHTFSLVYN